MKHKIIYHLIFWIAYVLFKSYLQFDFERDTITASRLFTVIAAQLSLLLVKVPMVYALFFVVDKYLTREWPLAKAVIASGAVLLVALALFLPVKQYIMYRAIYGVPATMKQTLGITSILSSLFILLFVSSIAIAIRMIRYSIRQRAIQQEMARAKLEAELQFLKAQINPHFLFNTLNNIYALARKKSDDTAEVVMKLSQLFRFILFEAQKPSITLAEEIQVLRDYIELERIRYSERLGFEFREDIDDRSQPIAPLVLLPFVENAFKHGAGESRFDTFIHLNLKVHNGQLYFTCVNSKSQGNGAVSPTQIGLNNIRRQLELVYPDHTLHIENTGTEFRVEMHLDLASQKNAGYLAGVAPAHAMK